MSDLYKFQQISLKPGFMKHNGGVFFRNISENAYELGVYFREKLNEFIKTSTLVNLVRGKGLLNAIVINDSENSETAWNLCVQMKENGLLAKPTHGNIIRFAPPLTISKEQLDNCIGIIISTLNNYKSI